jgi:hypothetical protein
MIKIQGDRNRKRKTKKINTENPKSAQKNSRQNKKSRKRSLRKDTINSYRTKEHKSPDLKDL